MSLKKRTLILITILLLQCFTAFAASEDFCEFASSRSAADYGWATEATNGKPTLEVTTDARAGRYALMAKGKDFMGDWGTLVLKREVDLRGAKKGDEVSFYVKQNVSSGMYLNIAGVYTSFPVTPGEWTKVVLDLDPEKWTWDEATKEWGRKARFAFYAREFSSPDNYLILDGLSFKINGKYLPSNIPESDSAESETLDKPTAATTAPQSQATAAPVLDSQTLPQENSAFLILRSGLGAWAVSRRTGSIAGGWNTQTRERCLVALESSYFLENTSDLWKALERDDKVEESQASTNGAEVKLTCSNPGLPGIRILKTYRPSGNTLTREIAFTSAIDEQMFVSMRSEARLDPSFRKDGAYVGAGSVGPIEAAALIQEEKQALHYTNSRGMILSNPAKGGSLAHYRSKTGSDFVFPWWSFSRAESAKDCFYYTPSGWKLPMSITKLSPQAQVSYEENLSIFPGDYHDFVTREYPSRPDVKKRLEEIGSGPAWLQNIKVATISNRDDTNRINRLVETTDEGDILVLTGVVGLNWADYQIDKGLFGAWGGRITGPELKEWVRSIKAISPRVKVGIYCYMDATFYNTRVYKSHPEWFRTADKEGNTVNHFQGEADNYTTMFGIDACLNEVLSQYDLILRYLPVDFVYLDDGLTNNLVNWQTGDVLRDADCEALFKGIREVVKRHGQDKAVFFNGQGNPYGDINYIEAYSRLSADNWRTFAGVGLGAETFLVNRPGERIIPLYWTQDLGREYVNRVLALGWVPSLEYTDEVESRAFVSAAYEIGNANPVNAGYSPDWRYDVSCKIESYAVRRLGDSGALLSFISHEGADVKQTVNVDTGSLGLDPGKSVYVWSYEIQDANEFKGIAGESTAREVYLKHGWTPDRVAAPELLYTGKYEPKIALDVNLKPLILNMVHVSNDAAGVYSIDGLPSQFLFAKARGVQLRSDEQAGVISVDVDSSRKACEVVVFARRPVVKVTLDGKAIQPKWISLGDLVMPVIAVPSGRHIIKVACAPENAAGTNLGRVDASVDGGSIVVRLPKLTGSVSSALITVRKDGLHFFNAAVKASGDTCRIPVSIQPGGKYEVAVRGISRGSGMDLVRTEAAEVELPPILPQVNLTPAKPSMMPASSEIKSVNRTIRGVEILSTGTETSSVPVTVFQPSLKPLTAEVSPETLTIEAGTTRKIEGFMGAAFGGFEARNLRTVRLRLENTFFEAYNCVGKGSPYHPYHPSTRPFAGFIVDYHTPSGYTKRVALGVGVMHPDLSTPYPGYGKGTKPDQLVDLGPIVKEGREKEIDLDLSLYAPDGWDGRVWFSAGTDWIAADRRLKAQIVSANHPISDTALKGTDPAEFQRVFQAKRRLEAPRIASEINIDGRLDEDSWKGSAETEEFFLVGGKGYPSMKTTARVMYDSENLYVAFTCAETGRKKPLFGKGNIWYDDEVEAYIDVGGAKKEYRQIMVNAGGSKAEFASVAEASVGASVAASIDEGRSWTVEMAIPFKGLGKTPSPGEVWGLNLCRYRPESAGLPAELITWSPTMQGFGSGEAEKFGELIFK